MAISVVPDLNGHCMSLTPLHSEWPKLYGVLAILSAIGLNKYPRTILHFTSHISCIFETNFRQQITYFVVLKPIFVEFEPLFTFFFQNSDWGITREEAYFSYNVVC